ncbi:Nardilysin [Trachymyrmex septentrionalis]|uniref:Nardilysin n=1 Tax=Trachymyrmex septentrionalis TaxID=34720 RepID=A0A195FLI8_9HYME|nr:Nardilysin [Trachymyrmex septentrionalis]
MHFFLTQKVECGLDVGVGRFSDTVVPDLSLFVEYMVSRGSEKYEHENDFIEFISEHNGCTNSMTDYEHTTFYFALSDIQKDELSSALDRFTHFFIKPLMKKDVIKRMIATLKNELQLSLTYDVPRKKNQLLSSTVPIGHPVNKFSWSYSVIMGNNIDDNKIDKLYDELHKFRERHYSAHRMKLVIQASLSLNALEKYVTKFFANIPSNWLPPDDFTNFKDNNPFNTRTFKKIYKVTPLKNISQLHITWAMPSVLHLYKSKPHSYILWIIKHKGEGSLIDYLRKKQWSSDFLRDNSEDDFEQNSIYTLFNFSLDLSHEGLQHVYEVLDAIFSFINLLKREGPQKRIYDEIYKITENNFRLLGNNDYIDSLCKNMHLYPPRYYITGRQNFFEYDPEVIQTYLDYLVPETVNIIIFNKNFHCLGTNKINLCTNTLFTEEEISQKMIERWKSIEPLPNFHLPLSNTFVTGNVSSLSIPVDLKYPIKIADTHLMQIWYYRKFTWPKCYINFQFIAYPFEFQSPKIEAFMEMYCDVLKQILKTELFPVAKAEIEYDIAVSETGIIIEMNGFNEKLLKFLPIIARYMDYSTIVTKQLFELVKVQQLERYYSKFMKPEKLIKNVKLWILKGTIHYTHIDTYIALRDINFEEFQKFVKSFTDYLYIQCLVQGDMMKDLMIEALQNYIKKIKCSPLIFNTIPQTRITQIPLGTSYCKLKNMNKIDTNSVITNYYQVGITSIELSILIDLIIIIMQEPIRNQLCIQEQLSNNVFCVRQDNNGILGLSITVHIKAHKYTTEHVDQRIEEFLKSFSKMLEVFPQEELNIIKEKLIIRELKQCTSNGFLKNEVDRNWNEITKREYMFNRFEKKTVAIKHVKIEEVREWFTHTLNGNDFRKLSLHVVGTDPKEIEAKEANDTAMDCNKEQDFVLKYIIDNQQCNETEGHHITNIEHYKADLFIYPCAKKIDLIDLN